MARLFQPKKKPKPIVKVLPDGREICSNSFAGKREYRKRREFMYYRDNKTCCLCGLEICCAEEATFEHKNGRGMGGSKRDDRVDFNGVAHLRCNQLKGSVSLETYLGAQESSPQS